jgi:hypothetical protein
VKDNITSFPDITQLANMINGLQMAAQQKANLARTPGTAQNEAYSDANIGSYMRGEVPDDVKYQLAQSAAERGVATGNVYGANSNADYLRALGLTSVGLQDKAQNWLTQSASRNPAAKPVDVTQFMITPLQQMQLRLQEEAARQAAERTALAQSQVAWNQTQDWFGGGSPQVKRTNYNSGGGWQPTPWVSQNGQVFNNSGNSADWESILAPYANPNAVAATSSTPQEDYDLDTLLYQYDVNNRIV